MQISDQKNFYSGMMFTATGGAFAWGSQSYAVGTGARMGPGYFPLILGLLLTVLGVLITFSALRSASADGEKIGAFAWRPLFFIIVSNLVFGVMLGGLPILHLPPMGLIAGVYTLTLIACLAGDDFHIGQALALGTVLSVLCYLAFIVLLKLQFPLWPVLSST